MGEMQSQQTYPYDITFQRYLLSLAVQDPVFLAGHRQCLSPDYFEDRSLKFLSGAILGFYDNYKQLPSEAALQEWSLTALQQGNKQDLMEITQQTVSFLYRSEVPNADYVRDRAVHFARRQGLKRAVLRALQVLREDGDPAEAMDMYEQAVSIGVAQSEGTDLWEIIAKIPSIWSEMLSVKGNIPTVFMPSFDQALYGQGPRRGELYVIQALPKTGKSMFLINFGAAAIALGHKVLHLTIGDLKEFDVAHRYASVITGVKMKTILGNDPSYIAALRSQYLQQNRLRIKYYSPYSLTTTHIRSYMSWLKATKGFEPDMLIIDYPDKMHYDRSNPYGELGRIYMEIKSILDDFNCVGWVASQSNRSATMAKLNQSANMAESFDKLANADGVIPLTRLDKHGEEVKLGESSAEALNFEGPREGHIMAYVENVRFGHDGFQIKIKYDYSRCYLFEDSPRTRGLVLQNQTLDNAQQMVGRIPQQPQGYNQASMVGPNG